MAKEIKRSGEEPEVIEELKILEVALEMVVKDLRKIREHRRFQGRSGSTDTDQLGQETREKKQ